MDIIQWLLLEYCLKELLVKKNRQGTPLLWSKTRQLQEMLTYKDIILQMSPRTHTYGLNHFLLRCMIIFSYLFPIFILFIFLSLATVGFCLFYLFASFSFALANFSFRSYFLHFFKTIVNFALFSVSFPYSILFTVICVQFSTIANFYLVFIFLNLVFNFFCLLLLSLPVFFFFFFFFP